MKVKQFLRGIIVCVCKAPSVAGASSNHLNNGTFQKFRYQPRHRRGMRAYIGGATERIWLFSGSRVLACAVYLCFEMRSGGWQAHGVSGVGLKFQKKVPSILKKKVITEYLNALSHQR